MQDQQIKIHTLGPKKLLTTARKSPNNTAQNGFGVNRTIEKNNIQMPGNASSKNIIYKSVNQAYNMSNTTKRTQVTFNNTYVNKVRILPQNNCYSNINLQLTRKVSLAASPLVIKPPIITAPTTLSLISTPIVKYLYVHNQQYLKLSLQLSELKIKYDELMKKLLQNQQNEQNQTIIQKNMEKVIESTRQIQIKISKIQLREQQNNQEVFYEMQKTQQKQCKFQMKQTAPQQFSCQLPLQKQKIQQQCLQIIQTVNMATQKIEQLQLKTSLLQKQVIEQKQWKQAFQQQNKRLRKMLQDKQNEKHSQLQTLKSQLTKLKQKQFQVQQLSFLKPEINSETNMKKSQKSLQIGQIDMNSHIYLLDQLNSSRFTINNSRIGQSRMRQSRVSQVYQ